jgi:transcriptional regulator GlxA family with amidase domain
MVETEPFDDSVFDTLIIGGSTEPSFTRSEGLLMYLRKAPEISRRVAATSVGAFTLAEAGLLDGKRATTHWNYRRELQLRYPMVKVQEDRIFVIDGSVWTSAGMTATMDLVLAMVERDIGPELARAADSRSSRPFSNSSRSPTEFKPLSHSRGKISTLSLPWKGWRRRPKPHIINGRR